MSKGNGRFAVMRDLQDHLIAGRVSALDVGIYTIIHWQADFKSGVWWGSAPKVHATAPRGLSLRDVQRSIQTLTDVGFLKPFHKHGQRGNYPVLLNKYEPLSGALKGFRLNAASSDDWKQPKYDSCALSDALSDAQAAPIQYAVSTTQHEAKKKKAATPPADARYGPFLEFGKAAFEGKYGHPPTWDCFGKDGSALAAFLRRAAHVTLETWQTHLANYFDSTEAFTAKQGGSLSYFVSRFDTFSSGPILEGGSNGKLVSFAEQRSRKNSAAIQNVLGRAEEASGDFRRALPAAHN